VAINQLRGVKFGVVHASLEIIRLALRPGAVGFIADFHENDFAEFAKSDYRAALACFPQGLMAVANGGAEFFPRHGGNVFAGLAFVII